MLSNFTPAQFAIQVTTAPASLVTDSAAMKRQLNLSDDDDLTQLADAIAQAQEHVETVLGRALLTQEWTLRLSGFPRDASQLIILPGGFVGSVTSITYLDVDGVSTSWSSGWDLHNFGKNGRGHLAVSAGGEWPEAQDGGMPVTIVYQVGWPDLASIPAVLVGCVKLLAATLFDENRGAYSDKPYSEARWYRSMLANWRIPRWDR